MNKTVFATVGLAVVSAVVVFTWNLSITAQESRSLRDTMLHAVDHYASIDARYEHRFMATTDSPEQRLTVEVVRQPGIGAAATLTRVDGRVITFVADGKQVVEHDVGMDEYTVWGIDRPVRQQEAFSFWDRLRTRLRKGKDAANLAALQREATELPLGWVSTAIFPQEWILGTYDVSQVIPRGAQEVLGRPTTRLEVVAPNGRTFVVNVDNQTGVLLRTEILVANKVAEVIQATRFRVNEPVDRTRFTLPDLTGKRLRHPG